MYDINRFNGKVLNIKRTLDGVYIPLDSDNRDYQEYLELVKVGKIEALDLSDKEPEPIPVDAKVSEALSIAQKTKLTEDDRDTLLKLIAEKVFK